ncbi:MAG: BACON domain-containing protein [Bacteroidales bacterium]|nr:BACON domain-containing protein [Bacteroidales bacterium]
MKRIFTIIAILCAAAFVSCTKDNSAPSIKLDVTESEVEFTGGQFTIAVLSNRSWSATTDADWITLSHASEAALAARTYILVTVQPNAETGRSATINITSAKGDASAVYTVKQLENSYVIRDADKFVEFMTLVAKSEGSNEYRLGADIDLAGKTLPEVESMIYAFNGQDHSIKNWTASKPLFNSISASGAVRNLKIDSSCKLTIGEDSSNFGVIAGDNYGVIENVVNNAAVSATALTAGCKGMICGYSAGTVTDCSNGSNFSWSGAAPASDALYFGGIAGRTNGASATVSNCSSFGLLTLAFDGVLESSVYAAGVVGAAQTGGKVLNCTNGGNVKVSCKGAKEVALVAGVVASGEGEIASCSNSASVSLYAESYDGGADGAVKAAGAAGVACYSGWEDKSMKDCSNSGDVTLRAGYSLGFAPVGKSTKYSTNAAGVVGLAYKCGLDNCTNSGAVTSVIGDIGNSASNYNTTVRQSIGGIVSSSWGNVTACTNTGKVVARWVTKEHSATLAKNFVAQAGGISGGDYHSDQTSTVIDGCTNEGEFSVTCDSSQSNNAFGAIVGWPGKENASGTNHIVNCVNRGNASLDGFSKSRLGGICGSGAKCTDCRNYGKVHYKGGLANSSVGGILGFNNFFNVTGCENHGNVQSEVKMAGTEASAAGGIGGIAGALGNTAQVFSGCKVDCAVIVPEGSAASLLVGVIGQNKATATKLEMGTEASPLKVQGSFNGTTLTAANFENFIRRPDFNLVNSNISFNVVFGN